MKEVEKLTNDAIKEVSAKNWEDCIKHVEEVEKLMWKTDGMTESEEVEKMEFIVDPESTDTCTETDCEMQSD